MATREELLEKLKTQIKEIQQTYAEFCKLHGIEAEKDMLSIAVDADGYYSFFNYYWKLPEDCRINANSYQDNG